MRSHCLLYIVIFDTSMYFLFFFFFFNDTATTEIYTLSLHDALPISFGDTPGELIRLKTGSIPSNYAQRGTLEDRKSTRLNSSHSSISYAVFCLKKKKKKQPINLYLLM